MSTSTLPKPDADQVRAVRANLRYWERTALAELNAGTGGYAAAMAEVECNRSWLNVYVDRRRG